MQKVFWKFLYKSQNAGSGWLSKGKIKPPTLLQQIILWLTGFFISPSFSALYSVLLPIAPFQIPSPLIYISTN